jgi:ComF family protein
VCDRCKPKKETDKWHFNRARSVFEYKSPVVEMVLALKYNAIGDVAKFVVPLMVAAVARYGMGVDVVLPVPLSPKRAKQRGYNQAELIANGVAGALGVPMVDNFLVRAKNTTPHKKMTYKQRCENLHGAFEIVPPYSTIKGKRVLLIDDVFTTGATVDECARVLKKAKPKSIEVLTVAGVSQMARKSK